MTYLSNRLLSIQPSPSIAANARVVQLRAEGHNIVNFTVGEPDADTPAHIVEGAIAAMRAGDTHYTGTLGTMALRSAIVEKLSRDNDLAYTMDEVVAGCGGKHIIYHAFAATLNAGDEVVVHTPYWVSYPDIARLCEGTPVIIPGSEADGFKLTAAALEAAITPYTKWVVLNTPNNPSGAVYREEELLELAAVIRRHPQVLVLSDEIYEHFVYDGQEHRSLLNVAPDLRDRTLIVNGASKGYAMTGWRLGFAAGPIYLISAIGKLLSQTTTCPSSISQAAAVCAFAGDQAPIQAMQRLYQQRRDLMLEGLQGIAGTHCVRPSGAFYAYVNVSGLLGKTTPNGAVLNSDADVVSYLLNHVGVATVGGAAYGMSPYIRLSFSISNDLITEGCQRIRTAIASLG